MKVVMNDSAGCTTHTRRHVVFCSLFMHQFLREEAMLRGQAPQVARVKGEESSQKEPRTGHDTKVLERLTIIECNWSRKPLLLEGGGCKVLVRIESSIPLDLRDSCPRYETTRKLGDKEHDLTCCSQARHLIRTSPYITQTSAFGF
jgi:hypothetical protein